MVQTIADFPRGAGPFPAIVLAPGQGYHMGMPALAQTASLLVAEGIAVYRFDWAYYTADAMRGMPSKDLADELQDMAAVLAAAKAEPRVDGGKLSVGGKSLGSRVAWQLFSTDKSLLSAVLLTPVCSHIPEGQSTPTDLTAENYPGIAAETRPLLFIAGDRDALCAPPVLYRYAASAGSPARVAIVGGDHGFENKALEGTTGDAFRNRSIGAVARLAADFVAEACGQ